GRGWRFGPTGTRSRTRKPPPLDVVGPERITKKSSRCERAGKERPRDGIVAGVGTGETDRVEARGEFLVECRLLFTRCAAARQPHRVLDSRRGAAFQALFPCACQVVVYD